MFLSLPADAGSLKANYTGGKFEPVSGCYFGACVAYDHNLRQDGESAVVDFAARAGKRLAVCYDYCRYGQPFPRSWADALCRQGIAPQIAWEPESLDAVRDDAYLRTFAHEAAACGGPIFLRYACEMNGAWTAYHRDPALYQQKFRLVHDVMAQLAPNVADLVRQSYPGGEDRPVLSR